MLRRSLEITLRLIVPDSLESREFVEVLGEWISENEDVLAGDIEIVEEIGGILSQDEYMN